MIIKNFIILSYNINIVSIKLNILNMNILWKKNYGNAGTIFKVMNQVILSKNIKDINHFNYSLFFSNSSHF